jgi:RNA polymerase sigma factor (sigma-70 family)
MSSSPLTRVIRQLRQAALARDGAGLTDGQLLDAFLARREEAAFEALVRRHGGLVFGVCRRLVGNADDAADAFQAVFLVLVRKAATLRGREFLGSWLYTVAYRTAWKARAARHRRRARETQVPTMPEPAVEPREADPELLALLDQELLALPEKYRVPVILCELEGRSRKEVAAKLRIPEGTLSSRLATARRRLAGGLARRGVTLPAGALAALAAQAAGACPPGTLIGSTVKAAMLVAAGGAAAGVISAQAGALAEGVLKAMLLTKLKIATACLLALGIVGGGATALAYRGLAGEQPEAADPPAPPREPRKPPAQVAQETPALRAVNVAGHVDAVAWSPDGRLLATLSRTTEQVDGQARTTGHAIKLWDARTGQLKRTLAEDPRPGPLGGRQSVAFAPDGKTLASLLWRRENQQRIYEVKLWDPETGAEKGTLGGATHRLHAIAFSPDGKLLAAGSAVITPQGDTTGGEVYVWDLQTGNLLWGKEEHANQVNGVAFAPDGKTLASASTDKAIKLWDAQTGGVKQTLMGHGDAGVFSVAFAPDGKTLASGGLDGTVRLWDVAAASVKYTLTEYAPGSIIAVAFSPDGRTVAGAGTLRPGDDRSGAAKLWDVQTGELKQTMPDPLGYVRALAFAPHGQTVAIGSWDQTVTLWPLRK